MDFMTLLSALQLFSTIVQIIIHTNMKENTVCCADTDQVFICTVGDAAADPDLLLWTSCSGAVHACWISPKPEHLKHTSVGETRLFSGKTIIL